MTSTDGCVTGGAVVLTACHILLYQLAKGKWYDAGTIIGVNMAAVV